MNRTWFLAALLVACTSGKPAKDPSPNGGSVVAADAGSGSMADMKKPGAPKPSVNWTKGPALSSSASDLVAWFEAQKRNGEPRMTRVPIVMKKGDTGWSTQGVKLGALDVRISDAALGMSMAMRAQKCKDATCPFLVEGFWRGKDDGSYHYEIRNAPKQPLTADELAAVTHVEVEGESGN
jgi:hypothetical protein